MGLDFPAAAQGKRHSFALVSLGGLQSDLGGINSVSFSLQCHQVDLVRLPDLQRCMPQSDCYAELVHQTAKILKATGAAISWATYFPSATQGTSNFLRPHSEARFVRHPSPPSRFV